MSDWIPSWALAELAAFFATQDLERASGVKVSYNDQIASRRGDGGTRQVDVSVRFKHASAEFLEILEVEDRSAPTGSEALDELIGKALAVGAQVATLVSTSGFAAPFLAGLQNPPTGLKLRAVHLAYPSEGELDPEATKNLSEVGAADDTRGTPLPAVKLRPFVFRDVPSNHALAFVFLGHVIRLESEHLLALSFPPPKGTETTVTTRAFTRPGSKQRITRLTVAEPSRTMTFRAPGDGSLTLEVRKRT